MQEAAKVPFSAIRAEQNQNYIATKTWDLVERTQAAKVAEEFELADNFSKEIKSNSKRRQAGTTKAQSEELEDHKHRFARPRLEFARLKDSNGARIPRTE